ncbi:HNH endonuclease [Devosia enhydra]|nr:HNH endonuclease [Devosia enhydra]
MAKARHARADAKRPNAAARGYDREWGQLRADFLRVYPGCKRCGGPATLVDHIVPIRVAPHRRLDPANLQSLCASCHSGAKQSADRRKYGADR